jgi:hypothetical protein
LTKAYIRDNTLNGGSVTVSGNLSNYLVSNKIFNSGISIIPNSQVRNEVLNNVGSNLSLDDVDSRIIVEVLNRSGSLKSSEGKYSAQTSNSSYKDNDKDGIDDEWEIANGLNPNNSSDGKSDLSGDGYTNLENFLHSLTQ